MSVPNQKKIIIERSSENVRKDYLKVSNESLHIAMYNLTPSTFLLWIYFTDNSKGYQLDLYPVDFLNLTNLVANLTNLVKKIKNFKNVCGRIPY